MNRRTFIKSITATLTGLIAWPKKAKASIYCIFCGKSLADYEDSNYCPWCGNPHRIKIEPNKTDVKALEKIKCDCTEQRSIFWGNEIEGGIIVACPHKEPYKLYYDGHTENLISKEAQDQLNDFMVTWRKNKREFKLG